MKPIFIFLLSLFVYAGTAQVQHQAEHYGFEKTGNSVVIGNTCYYLSRSWRIDAYCSDSVFLLAKSVSGQSLFRKYVMAMPWMEELQLVRAGNELVTYCKSDMRGCDYDMAESYFSGFDFSGTLLWSFKNFATVSAVVGSNSGKWRYFTPTHVNSFLSGGLLFDSRAHGLAVIYSAGPINGNGYVINYGAMSGARLRVANDTSLVLLDAAVTTTYIIVEQNSTGNFYGMNAAIIQKFDAGLNALATYSAGSNNFRTFSTVADTLVLAGMSNSTQPFYSVLNTSLQPVYTSTSNIEKFYPMGVAIKSNTLLVSGFVNASTGFYTNGDYSAFLSLPLGASIDGTKDIGIVSVNYTQSYYSQATAFDPYIWICNANVVLQNVGNDTIREFYLNHLSRSGGTGYQNLGLNRKYKATIAPQSSITVSTGTFSPYRTFVYPSASSFTQFCLHVSVPDSALDIDLSNNTSCTNVQVGFVGLKDLEFEEQVKVYPNPSYDKISISGVTSIKRIEVLSQLGSVVLTAGAESGEAIDVSMLPPGLYTIRVVTSSGYSIQRFIKE